MAGKTISALKEGTNQMGRLIPALSPDYVKPDERDIPALLKLVSDLSSQFNYYNFSNQIDGDWSGLLNSDPNILMILIAKLDVREYSKKYERLRSIIKRSGSEKEIIFYFNDLLEMAGQAALFMKQLLEKATDAGPRDNMVRDFSLILEDCMNDVEKLAYCGFYAREMFGHSFRTSSLLITDSSRTQPVYTRKDIFGESPDPRESILQGIIFIDDVSSSLKSKLSHLIATAEYYLRYNNFMDLEYNPHVGLVVAFLHLYTHLQNQLNTLTTKHLDLYYHDILGIKPRSSRPDSVYVLFESNISSRPIQIPAGSELMAKAEKRTKPLIYKLRDELAVSRAQVKELKTIFIGDTPLFSEDAYDGDNLKSVQVYSGDYPVIDPSAFSMENAPVSSWPVLGEDQSELPKSERTMEDSAIGIIIGSPLLYLPEGERRVQLTFKFEKEGLEDFNKFIGDFAERSRRNRESVLVELLSNSLKIDYTTRDGWQLVKEADTQVLENEGLEVRFTLGPGEKGMDIFASAIPEMPETQGKRPLPLVRLLIDNTTSRNPFSFFRSLLMERLVLKVNVKGFRGVKIQNNIGMLSPENPFQLFGPQPSVGTYLSIKNANIFNRFTKDFNIRIDWLNLPEEAGGFKSYYEGYGTGIENKSFRVRISTLSNGQFAPEAAIQQRFQLFETGTTKEGAEELKGTTLIKGIDFKKIEFTNRMSLGQEKDSESLFREGAIKITLDAPPEGFGNQLFPQTFSETLLHNSKRFSKALAIPRQPFIPNVKSISIDYTLEHTELFNGKLADDDSTGWVRVAHQYPFGFDLIYPGTGEHNYSFMPVFNYPSNLYIGIKDLSPGSDLSLLFKLEDNNFNDTVHESNLVRWSYLYQRNWVPMQAEDIVQDTTNNFINTGIIRLKIPYLISNGNNAMLNPDLYWLRACTPHKTDIRSRVIGIYAHAAMVTRVLDEDEEDKGIINLPSGCIKEFVKKVPGIQSIRQPFPSFGGREAEGDIQYRTRVSERLRHKQRPVTMKDIEQVILDAFPGILMVKCLGSADPGYSALSGIDLQIILIPKELDDGQFISEEPKVNVATLYQVRKSLVPLLSPFIKFEVTNPTYEKVKLRCKIKFKQATGFDEGFYVQALNNDIRKYICSWLYESAASLRIGATIYLSDMHNYIKNLDYVSVVTGFSMVHFFKVRDSQTGGYKAAVLDSAIDNISYISSSVPEAVLIPDRNHLITILHDFEYDAPSETGIGSLPVGSELLIPYQKQNSSAPKASPGEINPEEHFRFIINYH